MDPDGPLGTSDGTLNAKFWATVVGSVLICCIGAVILFVFLGMAWEAWGGLAALILTMCAIVGVAALVDRHKIKQYEQAGL